MMKRLIAAMSLAAFAHSAFAGASYGPRDPNTTERSLPDGPQTEGSATVAPSDDSALGEQAAFNPAPIEETESPATGDSTPSDGESAAAEEDSESPAEIDQ